MDDGQAGERQMRALREIARRHLADEDARRWYALVRPVIRLVGEEEAGAGAGEPAAARLGGLPLLPLGAHWPAGPPGGVPPVHLASLDCAALPAGWLDVALPADGTLLFFAPGAEGAGGPADGPLVYVPAGTPCRAVGAPPGVAVLPAVRLFARRDASAPFPDHSCVREAFALDTWADPYDHPVHGQGFVDELGERVHRVEHRVGGYPVNAGAAGDGAVSGRVMLAQFTCGRPVPGAQGGAQAGGDGGEGVLVWTVRREDLARKSFGEAVLLRHRW
ncbi:DUF1963 domain-containing protein [Streptomyces sp. NPDC090085]|uniref:DUF1963 domain-containing protein n=1 Tax=Streptomyces sp. NPDC090085 TaxID=3365943 RepID=UPI0038177E8B